MKATRLGPVVRTLAAVALAAAALTGCRNDSAAGLPADGKPGTGTGASSVPSPASPSPDSAGGAAASGGTSGPTASDGKGSAPASSSSASAGAGKKPDCADAPPTPDDVDPDEIALYRIEEIEGESAHLNLVLQHGAWGCPGKDTDGPPFVTTGEEARWALDQAAYVSATTPITESTENRRIGVQELVDWVAAHPDSGLVFRYETGDDGAIHRLDQVFTP